MKNTGQGHTVDIVIDQRDLEGAMTLAERLFTRLDRHWTGDGLDQGMYRPGYSAEEQEAIGFIREEAEAMGMEVCVDLAGNHYFVYPGADRNKPVVMMGSHLDAVPHGGRYDGPAGVVSAMAVARAMHDKGITPPQDFVVTVWRNEEGPWFKEYALGSKFITGQLGADYLDAPRTDTGRTLRTYMTDLGLDPGKLEAELLREERLLPVSYIGRYIETHIQQGPELAESGTSLGIVTGIRGHCFWPGNIVFNGKAAHNGATPQDRRLDAVIAGSYFVTRAVEELKRLSGDLVYSFPMATTGPDASPTTVPARFDVYPQVRSTSMETLKLSVERMCVVAHEAARRTGCTVECRPEDVVYETPAIMDDGVQDLLEDVARQSGIESCRMPSGAAHDAAILALAGVPCGMIFIRHGNEGLSHRPDETLVVNPGDDPFSLQGDFANAVRVMANAANVSTDPEMRLNRSFSEELQCRGGELLHTP